MEPERKGELEERVTALQDSMVLWRKRLDNLIKINGSAGAIRQARRAIGNLQDASNEVQNVLAGYAPDGGRRPVRQCETCGKPTAGTAQDGRVLCDRHRAELKRIERRIAREADRDEHEAESRTVRIQGQAHDADLLPSPDEAA